MVVQEDSCTSSDGSPTILILEESEKNGEDEEMILIQMLWRKKKICRKWSLSDLYFLLILWSIKFEFTYFQNFINLTTKIKSFYLHSWTKNVWILACIRKNYLFEISRISMIDLFFNIRLKYQFKQMVLLYHVNQLTKVKVRKVRTTSNSLNYSFELQS